MHRICAGLLKTSSVRCTAVRMMRRAEGSVTPPGSSGSKVEQTQPLAAYSCSKVLHGMVLNTRRTRRGSLVYVRVMETELAQGAVENLKILRNQLAAEVPRVWWLVYQSQPDRPGRLCALNVQGGQLPEDTVAKLKTLVKQKQKQKQNQKVLKLD